jgi:hypothetical protein
MAAHTPEDALAQTPPGPIGRSGLLVLLLLLVSCSGSFRPTGSVGGSVVILGESIAGAGGCWWEKDRLVLLLDDPDWTWGQVRVAPSGLVELAPIKGSFRVSANGNQGFLEVGAEPCATLRDGWVHMDCSGDAHNLYWFEDRPAEAGDSVSLSVAGQLSFADCGARRPL